jgi:ATP-dependent Lon protease
LKKVNLKLSDPTIRFIINHYTRESGVRNLERELAAVCRKAAVEIVTNNKKSVLINEKNIENYLGPKKFRYEMSGKTDEVGLATGLAWTSVGGETLTVEVNIMNGSGKFELTGQLGDVMKESARAAVSYIKSNTGRFKIDDELFNQRDIHIHVPEGAIPKDGPSAGITMATAMISALTDIPVRKNVAMTGEITLRGRVLPIGGLKEKVLAANRAGIDTVIIPMDNMRDADDIPENVKKAMKFVFVSEMFEVLDVALVNGTKGFSRDAKTALLPIKSKADTPKHDLRQ